MRELFIYYRIPATRALAARGAIASFQSTLMQRHPQLRARCLRRSDEHDGLQTWMETYSIDTMQDPDGVSPSLQRDIEVLAAGLHGAVATAAGDATPANLLEEVTVTAQRREQTLQKTPLAITVLTGSELATRVAGNSEDLDGVAPLLHDGDAPSKR